MSLRDRPPIAVRIVDSSTGEVLREIRVEPVSFWTVLAFELRWAIAAPLRALRRVFGRRGT